METAEKESINAILHHYKWNHTSILYDFPQTIFNLAGDNLVNDLRKTPDIANPFSIEFNATAATDNDLNGYLQEASTRSRVMIFFCTAATFRSFMYQAHKLGYTKGSYVFITLELFPDPGWLGEYQKFLTNNAEKDEAVTKAYESVLILSLSKLQGPIYEEFAAEVKKRALASYDITIESVSYYVTSFYDAAMYLAHAYKRMAEKGGNIKDGMAIAKYFWNSSYPGLLGEVAVSAIGDRDADFELLDMMSPTDRTFQTVGRFMGVLLEYSPLPNVSIVWPNGLPPDEPPCGFVGDKCKEEKKDHTVLIAVLSVLGAILMVTAVFGVYGYRRYKEEKAVSQKSWLIDPDEVKERKGKHNDSFMSKSALTISKEQYVDQIFCRTNFCRGQVCATRSLHLQEIELNRKVSLEFRQMQMATHPNMAKFIGAVIRPGANMILMEYCPRGSLQDMIQNESIELDWDFRYSLIHDIIQGMVYLHNSAIKVHGHLSSSNCVIDSRFSLKITDYGPLSILDADRQMAFQSQRAASGTINHRKMLWIAPEHLSDDLLQNGSSQPGDVYSFAIILHEVIMRCGPFETYEMELEEVLRQLKTRKPHLMRPDLGTEETCQKDLREIATSCWNDDPLVRPSFNDVEEIYRRIRRGKTLNIMDNLLQRMSDYADNLEQLAAERTKAYLEEKQKVEELLHRMLPPSIAKQLQSGRKVEPEAYDSVSIYFSDIVGFTTICAQSSPIQVVDLLNDLYTAFDSTIDMFKVYKVETIGDAYMCVSGLPEVIGDRHATEICNMALAIRHVSKGFVIRHLPFVPLQIRIGLHSGPVVAGVVGLKMPRYCLFGDTVNIASRMESSSIPFQIHMSDSIKTLIERYPEYKLEDREPIEIKGKGLMKTYFLTEYVDGTGRPYPTVDSEDEYI
ncbi:atrial natriuretic peptide receptor 1-like isoform X2 [Dreissena polymorpha]|uniref:atrial natriuretic peptide receptor 1-like isoform X2 n=1 Tax=Dreissena polymorpha TaxID=45954 RepID=UPI002263CCDD|nr:atrial natriuretic peptide receptor 1-like isoform X2 [Dreissena polymorpha]